jgi:hypothetical protein
MTDTSPRAAQIIVETQRRMSVAEKFHLVAGCSALLLMMQREEEARYASSERELLFRLACRHMPVELARKVYGPF